MELAVHLVNFDYPGGPAVMGETLKRVAHAAEESGIVNLSVMDHYLQMEAPGMGGAHSPMLEGYTTLGFLAGQTRTVDLQLLVTGVTYRHPGLLAKIVSTLDVLSGGRAMLGIGAAWYAREHAAYGVPFPPLAERFERLEETLQIVLQMWGPEEGPFDGRHYQLAETINSPQPVRQPHPPIMIGGAGERKTLRLVAKYADACNLFVNSATDADTIRHKLDVLQEHCEREGTDAARIRRTMLWTQPVEPTPAGARDFAEALRPYAAMGFTEVHVMPFTAEPVPYVEALGTHVVETLAGIG